MGALDIGAALLRFYLETGRSPKLVLQYIASALIGKKAYSQEGAIALGLLIHFAIAYFFTLVFLVVYSKFPVLSKKRFFVGVIYGITIWIIMNLIVLPVTGISMPKRFDPVDVFLSILILIFALGLPLAYLGKIRSKK